MKKAKIKDVSFGMTISEALNTDTGEKVPVVLVVVNGEAHPLSFEDAIDMCKKTLEAIRDFEDGDY